MLNSVEFDLPKPLAVVAHDAGGANQIIAMLQANRGVAGVQAYMEGPALTLWQKAFPGHSLCRTLENALEGSDFLLTGTGWASDLEYEAIRLGVQLGMPTFALLDHWVNYEMRFIRNNEMVVPDEYWVVDEYAYKIATKVFEKKRILKLDDFYLRRELTALESIPESENKILYLSEPMRSTWGRDELGEFQNLRYFFQKMQGLKIANPIEIEFRVHPSEDEEKYIDWFSNETIRFPINFTRSDTLGAAIGRSKWVVGAHSYALVVALAAGKRVVSVLPPWAPPNRLPHKGIIHLAHRKQRMFN